MPEKRIIARECRKQFLLGELDDGWEQESFPPPSHAIFSGRVQEEACTSGNLLQIYAMERAEPDNEVSLTKQTMQLFRRAF